MAMCVIRPGGRTGNVEFQCSRSIGGRTRPGKGPEECQGRRSVLTGDVYVLLRSFRLDQCYYVRDARLVPWETSALA